MVYKSVLVMNEKGLCSRLASLFVKRSVSFKSDITLEYNGVRADGKSLINVLALKAPKDSLVTVAASGPDEELAIKELEQTLAMDFK